MVPLPTRMPVCVAVIVAPLALTMPPENVVTFVTEMPTAGSIVPELVMPPVKVEPVTATAVPAETIVLALSIRMPWLAATILPLSTIEPLRVTPAMATPVLSVIVPLLLISPLTVRLTS